MELCITLLNPAKRAELLGPSDRHLRRIREVFAVQAHSRGDALRLIGPAANCAKAAAVVERLQSLLKSHECISDEQLDQTIDEVESSEESPDPSTIRTFSREPIRPKTDGQRAYVRAMLECDLVFCLGPAGTGKTYLAVAVAVHLLKTGKTRRVSLVRPAVEAGEKLGFLPGDMQQKVNPYLRPLFDAMHDMMTYDQLKRFLVNDIVEVIPLAFMRGRTLNQSVIILDEAQNATPSQMLMFLTRLGNGSKMIVTGDDSQVDLAPGQPSGLSDAVERLGGVQGIEVLRLTDVDIVRHRLVQDIVNRYANAGAAGGSRRAKGYNPAASADGAQAARPTSE